MEAVLGLQQSPALRRDHLALLRAVAVLHRIPFVQSPQRAGDQLTALPLAMRHHQLCHGSLHGCGYGAAPSCTRGGLLAAAGTDAKAGILTLWLVRRRQTWKSKEVGGTQEWLSRLAAGYSARPMRCAAEACARGTTAIALTVTCPVKAVSASSPSVVPDLDASQDRERCPGVEGGHCRALLAIGNKLIAGLDMLNLGIMYMFLPGPMRAVALLAA